MWDKMSYKRPPKKGFGLYYDPVFGYIPLGPTIRRALDLKSMQRLRYIKQLSTLFLFYSGATHSRFEHSIGVCYLAERVYEGLFNKWHNEKKEWPLLTAVHKLALQLGALFHDVGHGPWSHVSELFCEMKEDYRKIQHSGLTELMIKEGFGSFDDIPTFIVKEAPRIENNLKIIGVHSKDIEEWMQIFTPENIANIAVGKPPSDDRYTFLSNIVSGTFDVDRLDYLRRDAYHSGVETGDIDIWEIIHNYTLAEEDGKWIAKLQPSASTSVEVLLSVRDLTYRQFYFTKLHRVAQEMIIRAMTELLEKCSVDDMIVKNDEELLLEFEGKNGTAFSKEISKRIKLRHVYEPLPFTLNVSRDLDEKARTKWTEIAFGVPSRVRATEQWFLAEKKASTELGLPNHERVIYDIRAVPIVKVSEYENRIFFDEFTNKSLSLFDLAPHTRMTKGVFDYVINGKKTHINLEEKHIQEISNLSIALPYEYIYNICEKSKKLFNDGKKEEGYINFVESLKPAYNNLSNLLEIDKPKLLNKFETEMRNYLDMLLIQNTD